MQFQCVDRAGDDTVAAAGASFGIDVRYKSHDLTTRVPCIRYLILPEKVEKPADGLIRFVRSLAVPAGLAASVHRREIDTT
jgi:hypothetical protein